MDFEFIASLLTILSLSLSDVRCDYKNPYMFDTRKSIVHLFEWKFVDVAEEWLV